MENFDMVLYLLLIPAFLIQPIEHLHLLVLRHCVTISQFSPRFPAFHIKHSITFRFGFIHVESAKRVRLLFLNDKVFGILGLRLFWHLHLVSEIRRGQFRASLQMFTDIPVFA